MSRKILVPIPVFSTQCADTLNYLQEQGFVIIQNQFGLPFSFERYRDIMPEISAVIAGVEVWNRERMELCPNLKIITRFGMGVDNFDLFAASALGITCTNAPGCSSTSVAQHAFGLILDITRRLSQYNLEVHEGKWVKTATIELTGKVLGLIGFGGIARKVATIAKAFGMRIVAYDAYPDAETAGLMGIELLTMESVLAMADVVSVHVPGTVETENLISDTQFMSMKKGSFFVNTSRGSVVDEKALYKALVGGPLVAAAADVFQKEPIEVGNPLLTLPNFIATPHVAAITIDANRAVADCNAKAIVDYFNGKNPDNIVNKKE